MKAESQTRFNTRAFTSLTMVLSGAGLPITGIANHLQQMEPMTLTRHAWMAAHNSLAVLFVIGAVWHVALNRRPLLKHLTGLASRIPSISREAFLAVTVVSITLFIMVGHAYHLSGPSIGR